MKLFFVTPYFSIYFSLTFLVLSAIHTASAQQIQAAGTLTAILENHQVQLTWKEHLAEEIDFFIIERSLNGRAWETLAQIEGAEHKDEPFQYQTTDVEPYEGTSFYRLQQVDYRGQAMVSDAVEVLYEVSMEQFFMSQERVIQKLKKNH